MAMIENRKKKNTEIGEKKELRVKKDRVMLFPKL